MEVYSRTGDQNYLDILAGHIEELFEVAEPDIVFIQAGCDKISVDPLRSLQISREGITKSDAMAIAPCM